MKWQLTLTALNNTLLNLTWSSEQEEKKPPAADKTPGPITDRVTAPQTAFGLQQNSNPSHVHKRSVIK